MGDAPSPKEGKVSATDRKTAFVAAGAKGAVRAKKC
jgi:hypothetical protein